MASMDRPPHVYTRNFTMILLIAFYFGICYHISRKISFGGDTYDYCQPLYSVR